MDSQTTAQAIATMLAKLPPEEELEPSPAEPVPVPLTPGNPGLIFSHQQPAFRELITTARAFGKENWFSLPILPRWHTLLVGVTGTGKSHLVRSLGKFLGWPVLTLWATRWIVAGGRGNETWHEIARWLSRQEGKCLIFVDEIDKLLNDATDASLWGTHLRTEIYQLFDRDLPAEIDIDDSDSENSKLALWAKAQMNLRCNTLMLGAGAFQCLWENRPKTMGFYPDQAAKNTPSKQELKSVLPAELINRFSKVLMLSRLTESDYLDMIHRTAGALPREIQANFIKIAGKNLHKAITEGSGARFCEECITEALLSDAEVVHTQKPAFFNRRTISNRTSGPTTEEREA